VSCGSVPALLRPSGCLRGLRRGRSGSGRSRAPAICEVGSDVDRDLIRAWWSLRCLTNVRWLAEHGYGSPEEFLEVAVLRSRP
jgi:hypothetical protein